MTVGFSNISNQSQIERVKQPNNSNGNVQNENVSYNRKEQRDEVIFAAAATDALSETPTIKDKIESIISSILGIDGGDIDDATMNNISMKISEIKEERFEKENEKESLKKEVENNTANINKKDIKKSYSAYASLANSNAKDIIGIMIDQGKISEAEKSNFDAMYKKLLSADGSNASVIEGTKHFIQKAKEMEKRVNSFKVEKNEEFKDSAFNIDTIDDIKVRNHKEDVDGSAFIKDQYNPFMNSAYKTFYEDDKVQRKENASF